jgi:hypothetical protein
MNPNIHAFLHHATKTPELRDKLISLENETDGQVLAEKISILGVDNGFAFSGDEFATAVTMIADEELLDVTGGTFSAPKIVDFSNDDTVDNRSFLKKLSDATNSTFNFKAFGARTKRS